ncbi:oxidoreductase [Nocardia asteroides]|uniref:oxidoreductase n=1 Tax=Nocardia asteroides TaxID=1824 RepID=UPI00343C0D9A
MNQVAVVDLPDLAGRTAVVTGANSGLGLATARAMAEAGAHVILAVRTPTKGERAVRNLRGSYEVRRLDLADLNSVRMFADNVDRPFDLLINNAGVMALPECRTADGFEMHMGTNHLGHFALTCLLLDRISGRVVTVSSMWHRFGRIRLDDLNFDKPHSYERWAAYSQSKLANLLFTAELQHRLSSAGSKVSAVAAHPGWASTELQRHSENRLLGTTMRLGNRFVAQSATMGAGPILFAATGGVPRGSFSGPNKLAGLRGSPTLVGQSKRARDMAVAAKLWALSEELTGVRLTHP